MEKSVGGVDLDELMRARQQLDQERGVETDPNMYDDYGKNHNESSAGYSEDISQPIENIETNNANSLDNNSADFDKQDNQIGWEAAPEEQVADSYHAETSSVDSQTVESSQAYEPEPAKTETPRDLNMYDIFSQFEVKENANIKSEPETAPVVQNVEPATVVDTPAPVMENASEENVNFEPTIEQAEEESVSETSGIDDLVNEILQGYDLDAEDDESEETAESEKTNVLDFNNGVAGEEIKVEETPNIIDINVDGDIQNSVVEPIEEKEIEETPIAEESVVEKYENFDKNDALEQDPKFDVPEEIILENISQPASLDEENSQPVDTSNDVELITDFAKLKDLLQQELEEAENAEIEKIEELTEELPHEEIVQSIYAEIPDFNFVEEIVNDEFKNSDKLSYLIGKGEDGKCVYGNFKEQYNLAIFGKEKIYTNTLVNSILLSLSLKNGVNDLNFIILDADVNSSFDDYNKSSYIFFNRIAKTNKEIFDTLIEISKEIDDRYERLATIGAKNIDQYNIQGTEAGLEQMPYLVVVFGNYTKSSQATDNDKIVACLHRILKYGRIAGVYAVVVATNPIEEDEINYNLPSRIALKNEDDSLYTIGETGADKLLDENDVLYSNIAADKVVHLKLPNISQTEKELLITGLEE